MSSRRVETPPSYFEEVNERVDWHVILAKFGIKIRKQRRDYTLNVVYMILCPFHKEKTPSMSFRVSVGGFYCFGCGAGGDIFDFVVMMLNEPCDHSKMRAYRWFKKNFAIPLPWEKSNGQYIYR